MLRHQFDRIERFFERQTVGDNRCGLDFAGAQRLEAGLPRMFGEPLELKAPGPLDGELPAQQLFIGIPLDRKSVV